MTQASVAENLRVKPLATGIESADSLISGPKTDAENYFVERENLTSLATYAYNCYQQNRASFFFNAVICELYSTIVNVLATLLTLLGPGTTTLAGSFRRSSRHRGICAINRCKTVINAAETYSCFSSMRICTTSATLKR
ncbi:hypothetical protein FALBO_8488 [Fusarium albosuccineum]|uniref:Uncharacterized protein n=1 Tax=Fusarium albosuccineum TaxID=1237068 RepID=A0A8H4LAK8_9HYPO|nr:hypothetical protein FALBO_8488 [Fusarium albosuccineum]